MAKKKQEKIQFRYYEMPRDSYVLPILDERWSREYGHEILGLHFHNHLEIGYCCHGEGKLLMEKEEWAYFPETYTIIPRNCPHATVGRLGETSVWDYLFVDVEKFLGDMYPGRSRLVEELCRRISQSPRFLTRSGSPILGDLIQEMIREMREKKEFYQESIKGYLLAFLMDAARMPAGGVVQTDKNVVITPKNVLEEQIAQVEKALDYVNRHYTEPVKVQDMAMACGLSETHFRRLFLKSMHVSPMEYVNKVRIRAACAMMSQSTVSLEDVAMKTGFISMSTFNRNFRKFLGISPSGWRRQEESPLQELYQYTIEKQNEEKGCGIKEKQKK